MPALEMAQETGKLIAWLKKEGESVSKGEPLLEIETDKAVMEVESPADGVLAGVKAAAGSEIQVGSTLGWIVKPGEAPPLEEDSAESRPARRFAATPVTSAQLPTASTHAPASAREIKISPKARRLATEKGVDLAAVRGSGTAGEILAADVLAAAESRAAHPAVASQQESLSAVARLMAERTTHAWTAVPHFFVNREVDATALNDARTALSSAIEQSHGVKLTHTDLFVALIARVLATHPRINASWAGNLIRFNAEVNISLAMAVSDGVIAPVIRKADKSDLGAIAVQRRVLAERARENKLRPGDFSGGTFTISNLGMYEVDSFTAIITPPQAGILAIGRIANRVVVHDGQPAIRPMITLTLSVDHRVADGARGAEFMRDVANAITNPDSWLSKM